MPHFNSEAFEKNLNTVPDDILIEMAADGVITRDEIQHLAQLLNLDPEVAAALERHAEAVGEMILSYVEEHLPDAVGQGMCHMTGAQAVEVMRHLLKCGLIEKCYESTDFFSLQEGLPQGKTIHDVGKGSTPRGKR